MLARVLFRRPNIEAALSSLDKGRLRLPVIDLSTLFADFATQPVTLRELPTGPWSSPIADIVILAKIALCLKPRRVLEIGSFRGFTAKLLAEHTGSDALIVALDRDPRHGAAYRDAPVSAKIERRVGKVDNVAFVNDARGSYDLIFVDADHSYEAVKHDTAVLLPLLAHDGIMVWHDYANWGRFSKTNGVPEMLHELARTLPVFAISGSWLAAYPPAWTTGFGAEQIAKATVALDANRPGVDPWTTAVLR